MSHSLFAGCAIDAHAFTLRAYPGGARIFVPGDRADIIYMIVFGQVALTHCYMTHLPACEVFADGDAVGLEAAFADRRRETATSMAFTVLGAIPRNHLRVLIEFEPRIALNVARIMHERLKNVRAILVAGRR